jgi:hypothetical protein
MHSTRGCAPHIAQSYLISARKWFESVNTSCREAVYELLRRFADIRPGFEHNPVLSSRKEAGQVHEWVVPETDIVQVDQAKSSPREKTVGEAE